MLAALVLSLSVLAPPPVPASRCEIPDETVLWVAPAGDDAWSGRHAAPTADGDDGPLATLERAQALARSSRAEEPARGVTVRLRAGVYRLTQPLVFGPRDGGGAGSTVTWEAARGERVVLSGGSALEEWRREDDGTCSHPWSSATPRQLFVAGQRRPRARTPDEGWLRVAAAGPDGRTSLSFEEGDLSAWPDVAGAELVFLHDWSMSRVGIERVDEATGTVHLAHAIGARHPFFHITGFEAHPRYRVENVRAAWDRPGEWLFDPSRGRIHYRPLRGEAPEECEAAVPLLERLLEVRGEPARPVRRLRFVGLSFEHARAADPPGGFAGVQAGFHEHRTGPGEPVRDVAPPAAVHASHAVECAFVSCTFEHLGGTGLWLGAGCKDGLVRGCTFSDVGANGLMIGEPDEPAEGDAESLVSRIACADNVIERCGVLDHGAVGLWVGLATHVHVLNNEVRDLPYTGISLGWIWDPRPSASRGHHIERNHIHHVMQLLSDGGGIYTLGRQPDTVLGHNLIHDVPLNAGRAQSNGIFVDEGSTELLIEGNVIHSLARSPIRFHKAGRNVVKENVLVAPEGVTPFAFHACSAEDEVFEANVTPDAREWSTPSPAELEVGPR